MEIRRVRALLLRKKAGRLFCALSLILVSTAPAYALDAADIRTWAVEGDIQRLEAALSKFAGDVEVEEKSHNEFSRLFDAFDTTHPSIVETVLNWRRELPKSPHALVAEATIMMNVGLAVRGAKEVRYTPQNSLLILANQYASARQLLIDALSLNRAHSPAARRLYGYARFSRDEDARRIARQDLVLADDETAIYFNDLNSLLPKWGGQYWRAYAFCAYMPFFVDDVGPMECLNYIAVEDPTDNASADMAAKALYEKNPYFYTALYVGHLLRRHRTDAAMDVIESTGHQLTWSQMEDLFGFLGSEQLGVLWRAVEKRLKDDPNHPRYLRILAELQLRDKDVAAATETIEQALQLGFTIPSVRKTQLITYFANPSRRAMLMTTIEDALADTSGDSEVMATAIELTTESLQPSGYGPKWTPPSGSECAREFIRMGADYMCQAGRGGRMCEPSMLKYWNGEKKNVRRPDCQAYQEPYTQRQMARRKEIEAFRFPPANVREEIGRDQIDAPEIR